MHINSWFTCLKKYHSSFVWICLGFRDIMLTLHLKLKYVKLAHSTFESAGMEYFFHSLNTVTSQTTDPSLRISPLMRVLKYIITHRYR